MCVLAKRVQMKNAVQEDWYLDQTRLRRTGRTARQRGRRSRITIDILLRISLAWLAMHANFIFSSECPQKGVCTLFVPYNFARAGSRLPPHIEFSLGNMHIP